MAFHSLLPTHPYRHPRSVPTFFEPAIIILLVVIHSFSNNQVFCTHLLFPNNNGERPLQESCISFMQSFNSVSFKFQDFSKLRSCSLSRLRDPSDHDGGNDSCRDYCDPEREESTQWPRRRSRGTGRHAFANAFYATQRHVSSPSSSPSTPSDMTPSTSYSSEEPFTKVK